MREAAALGFIGVEERRLSAWRNAPNRVTITSPEWLAWLKMRSRKMRLLGAHSVEGGGRKSVSPTNTGNRKQDALRSTAEAQRGLREAGAAEIPHQSGQLSGWRRRERPG
jgi:hypothetical protein